jgi:2-oxoglutarate ferredoxin oxidoreductase subunit beta
VTYGEPEAQLKVLKKRIKPLSTMGHDPTDRIRAMDLAQHYGKELYVGIFYKNPDPPPTFESQAHARHEQMRPAALPKERILDIFMPQ